MNPNSFTVPPAPSGKNGNGCILKILIGIAVLGMVIVVGAWLLIMHSSLPLRMVVNLIEKGGADSNLKITGVSGSLSSGLSFEKVRWDDGEITDMRFHYSGIMDVIRRQELIIHEMHVGSATITTNSRNDNTKESEAEATEQASPKGGGEPAESYLRLVRIDRVSLNQIHIHNAATGDRIAIPKIEWTGFKSEKGAPVELGDLKADSDYLVIRTTNPPPASVFQKRFEITLMPELHAMILKPIHIDAHIGERGNQQIYGIKAFDESVIITPLTDGSHEIRAVGVKLADFLDAPFPSDFHLTASYTKMDGTGFALAVRGGEFVLGTKAFTIEPTTVTGTKQKPEGTALLALSRIGGSEIRYEIPATSSEEASSPPILTRTPPMAPEDLMALVFHDREFSALAPEEQETLRNHMSKFSFSN